MRCIVSGVILAVLVAALPAPGRADVAYTAEGAVVSAIVPGFPDLPATVLKPAGAGPFPAVVILHDCSGLGAYSSHSPARWGAILAAQGYVALVPDSFLPRGYPDGVCTATPGPEVAKTYPYVRATDAYAALIYLRKLPYVDGRHVFVMGGSHGGSSTLATMVVPLEPDLATGRRNGFAAGVALYPGCGAKYGAWSATRLGRYGPVTVFQGTYEPLAPLLILIGADDDWAPAEPCRVLTERAAAAGYPVSIKIYPGALHSFDSPNPRHYLANANNPNQPNGRGATMGGNADAWADAIVQVKAFFAAALK